MKFIGLSKGRLEVLEDIDPFQLRDLKADFAWVDADKLESRAEVALKELYGVQSLGEYDLPAIIPQEKYTLIVINYYLDLSRKSLQIIAADNLLITLHPGPDAICDEVMASVNEMIVSGDFNTGTVLHGLFSAAIVRYIEYVRQMRELLRNVGTQVRSEGMTDLGYLFKLIRDTKELSAELYDTKQQISEIALKLAPVNGIKDTDRFKDLYGSAHVLSALSGELSDEIARYENELLLAMWRQLGRAKAVTLGMSVFAVFMGIAALSPMFPVKKMLGLDPLYAVAGILVAGLIAAVAVMQSKARFRLQ